ncbi:hypothetical protein F5B20DRAFT_324670 [Whalleya microplaca]|nr:hypothetical protein F5B20DRAFT_324670 [Whalleya microplaca]
MATPSWQYAILGSVYCLVYADLLDIPVPGGRITDGPRVQEPKGTYDGVNREVSVHSMNAQSVSCQEAQVRRMRLTQDPKGTFGGVNTEGSVHSMNAQLVSCQEAQVGRMCLT